ncbi:MAG: prepilin-type N-terminal cleavage/methylation domain-containing protein [Planctomycetota bacterium]
MRRCSASRTLGRALRDSRAGFSLLEVIVVSAIFAVISIAILRIATSGQRTASSEMLLQRLQTEANEIVDSIAYDLRYAMTYYSKAGYDPNFLADGSGNYETHAVQARNDSNWSGLFAGTAGTPHLSIRFWKSKGYSGGVVQETDFYYWRPVKAEVNVENNQDDNGDGLVDECYLERRFVPAGNINASSIFNFHAGSPGASTPQAGYHATARGKVVFGGHKTNGAFKITLVPSGRMLFEISIRLAQKDTAYDKRGGAYRILDASARTYVFIRD